MKTKKKSFRSEDLDLNLNKALRFLSFRPRSEKEIQDFFKKKQVSKETSGKVINKLKEYKFLDDFEFAKWWVEQRTLVKPRSWRVIKIELRQKGISKEIMEILNVNSELEEKDDLNAAIKLAEKRIPRYKSLPRQEIYKKLGRFLLSKGFNYEIIKRSIDEVFSKEYNQS